MNRRAVAVAVAIVLTTLIFACMFSNPGESVGGPTRTTPSEPRNFAAESRDKQIILRWEEPLDNGDSDRIGFVMYRGPSPDNLNVLKSDFGPYDFSYTDKNLNNGQYYYYSIAAINELSGVGDATQPIMVKPVGRPTVPRNITYTYSSKRIDFQWLEPLDDGGDDLLGYYVFRGPNQDASQLAIKLGNSLTYTDTTVSNGMVYFYRFMAFNGYSNGTVSDYIQVTPRGKPGEPGNFNVTAMDRKVSLNWTYPSDDGGGAVFGYHIFRGLSEESMGFYQYVSSRTEYLDTNITNGYNYYYSVAAENSEGVGTHTDVKVVFPIGIPDSPLNLTVEPGDTKAMLSWKTPADNGGSALMGYKVFRTIKGEPMKEIEDVGLKLEYTDENLTNGNTYYYQVRAYNDQGNGFPSETVDIKPDFAPAAPENFRMTELDSYLKLMWALPSLLVDYPVLEFIIYRGTSEDDLQVLTMLGPANSSFEDHDVEIGTEYYYAMTGRSRIGEGQLTSVISGIPYTAPSLIRNLAAETSDKNVHLTWDPPESPGGREITNYRIFRGENIDQMAVIDIIGGTLTDFNDTNVQNGVTYYYSIMAINEKTEGDRSAPIEANPLGPPGSPRNLIISVLEDSVLLEWEQPRSNGGRTITGYVILRGPSQLNLSVHAEVGFVLNYTDTDLERGVTYYYAVLAENEIGQGRQSNTETGRLPVKTTDEEEKTSVLPYAIGGVVVFLLVIVLVVVAFVMSKRKKAAEDEEEIVLEESEKEKEHRLVLERRKQMKEFTDVALTTEEAHAHDQEEHHLTYDDLYGNIPSIDQVEETGRVPVPQAQTPADVEPNYQPPTEELPPQAQPASIEENPETSENLGEAEPDYIPPESRT